MHEETPMKRVVAGIVALIFMSSATWTFLNEATVEDWLRGQLEDPQQEEVPLVPLQDDEHWLVVVVDFEQSPASDGWGTEEAATLMEQAVVPYVEQLSGNASSLEITLHTEVVRASMAMGDYGRDENGKDTGADGSFLPAALAEEAVSVVRDGTNWSMFDLNNDNRVDRFLVLHTTKGQEETPSAEHRIWSHFTQFENPIDLPGDMVIDHYTMASLQTGSSGVGTMIHEMLHQMGAVDLYPVHDEIGVQSWKGPGDWDIMASGNWNGGGRWPAMPTGANLELLRADRIETLDLTWPTTATSPCIGPSVVMKGVTQGGSVLKIPLNDDESIFIEHRSNSGFDSRLPGHGLLVSHQDLGAGDFDRNEVNTNSKQPWLKVIEADGGDDLVRGSNQGEQSDLFLNGTSFGHQGVEIRSHDGLLVPWTATVFGEEDLTVSFTAENCSPPFTLDLPDHGATLLKDQHIDVWMEGDVDDCTSSLTSSDGREVTLVEDSDGFRFEFSRSGIANAFLSVQGTITCANHSVNINYPVHILNRLPLDSTFEATIHPISQTVLEIPLSSYGAEEQRFSVVLDGPVTRVASGQSSIVLSNASVYELKIEPNGLLTENMLVYGSLHLMTEEGMTWTVELALEASSENEQWWRSWTEPGRIIGLMLTVVAISAFTSALPRRNAGETIPTADQPARSNHAPSVPEETDAWGRAIDTPDSAESADVQEGI